jgi:hypothetical protein
MTLDYEADAVDCQPDLINDKMASLELDQSDGEVTASQIRTCTGHAATVPKFAGRTTAIP